MNVILFSYCSLQVSPDLSSALFHQSMVQFSKAGVLHLYLDQLRDLLPKNFRYVVVSFTKL